MNDRLSWDVPYKASTLEAVERRWNFRFPPDLKLLFLARKPVGYGVWDWDKAVDEDMENSTNWLASGFAFDAIYNGIWIEDWGPKPDIIRPPANWGDKESVSKFAAPIAHQIKEAMVKRPRLIPICGHRYIVSDDEKLGQPILSIYQTDIIFYGRNLRHYFLNEFGEDIGEEFGDVEAEPVRMNYWSDFLDVLEMVREEYQKTDACNDKLQNFFSEIRKNNGL